jgi:ABC-type transport system involved in cytochrome c biogenesis permease subunit
MSIKTKANEVTSITKTCWSNAQELVDAACLGAVSGYSIYESLQKGHTSGWYKALLVAGIVIALQALSLFVRHLNKPVAK